MDGITVSFDQHDLAKIKAKLGEDLYRQAVGDALVDVVHYAEGEVKARTPVVTGNLQRSIVSDVTDAQRWPDPETSLASAQPYVWWIETGTRLSDGAELATVPGGYRMFEKGAAEAQSKAGVLLKRAAKAIEEKWGK